MCMLATRVIQIKIFNFTHLWSPYPGFIFDMLCWAILQGPSQGQELMYCTIKGPWRASWVLKHDLIILCFTHNTSPVKTKVLWFCSWATGFVWTFTVLSQDLRLCSLIINYRLIWTIYFRWIALTHIQIHQNSNSEYEVSFSRSQAKRVLWSVWWMDPWTETHIWKSIRGVFGELKSVFPVSVIPLGYYFPSKRLQHRDKGVC